MSSRYSGSKKEMNLCGNSAKKTSMAVRRAEARWCERKSEMAGLGGLEAIKVLS
jgi:hypothetical protein